MQKDSFILNQSERKDDLYFLNMIKDTSNLAAEKQANKLGAAATAAYNSNTLAEDVEFWKWMQRNYSGSDIFNSPESIQAYIKSSPGRKEWMEKVLQGKGYEWDWMTARRHDIRDIFHQYDAGDIANRPASDVTERNIFTNQEKEYQMKAYTSKANPDLHNTPKEMTVVTNSEKVDVVKQNGYENVLEFEDSSQIKKTTDRRMKQAENGKAYNNYNIVNVGGAMAKSGAIGFVIGIGIETASSYNSWKAGEISDDEYLSEVLKSGANSGIDGAISTGIMVPVSAAVTAAGITSFVTIPVAIVVSVAVDAIVAPCFGRGEYKKILNEAKYYQNLEGGYRDLVICMRRSSDEYIEFLNQVQSMNSDFKELDERNYQSDEKLKKLYDQI